MNNQLFEGYEFPKTNTQEILLTLITKGEVSIFDFPYLSGFRTRVSELALVYGIRLQKATETKTNKFGNSYNYAIHKLPEDTKDSAKALYNKLTKKDYETTYAG